MKIALATGLSLAWSILAVCATPQDDEFQKIAHDYIEQDLRANPEEATELGDHRFDGLLTDYSPEARAKDLAAWMKFSRAQVDAAEAAAKAAAAKNADQLSAASDALYETCSGCHKVYMAK